MPGPGRAARHARYAPRWAFLAAAGREVALLLVILTAIQQSRGWLRYDWVRGLFPDLYLADGFWWDSVLAAATLITLARRWLPGPALVAAAALFGMLPVTGACLAVTAYHAVGRVRRTGPRLGLLALALAAQSGCGYLAAVVPLPVLVTFHLISAGVAVAVPAIAWILTTRADRLVRVLLDHNRFLAESRRLAELHARLAERARIAEQMHDQLGRRLSILSLHAGALEVGASAGDHLDGQQARQVRGMAQQAMRDLRSIIGLLRHDTTGPPADENAPTGTGSPHPAIDGPVLRDAVRDLVAESAAAGLDVTLRWPANDLRAAPEPVRQTVHQIIREGLTNAHRRAPDAAVLVAVTAERNRVAVTVANTVGGGATAAPPGTGSGLADLARRVHALGGRMCAGPDDAGGFRLAADLPYRPRSLIVPAPETEPAGPEPAIPAERGRRLFDTTVTVALGAGILGVAAVLVLVLNSMPIDQVTEADLGPQPYGRIQLGETRRDVLLRIGADNPLARLAADRVETAAPAGTTCLYGEYWVTRTEPQIHRYCFRDDLLVEKRIFTLG